MGQFKDLKDVKVEVAKERSQLGDRFDRSMEQSEQTESVQEDDDGNSKGGAY